MANKKTDIVTEIVSEAHDFFGWLIAGCPDEPNKEGDDRPCRCTCDDDD